MERVFIRHRENNAYQLEIENAFAGRLGVRLNIFLHSFPSVTVLKSDYGYHIDFGTNTTSDIADKIREVTAYITKQGVECFLDDYTSSILSNREAQISKFESTKQNLTEIIRNSPDSQDKYNDFIHFCDENLSIKLRDYQYSAALLLTVGEGGFDFSVPGAGKTIITYASYAYQKNNGNVKSIFVIGPSSSYNAWFDEYITCFGRTPDFQNLSILSMEECKTYLLASPQNHSEITFINLEKIRMVKDYIIQYLSNDSSLLVIDEGHKVKNPNAASTQAAMEIARCSKENIVLTGTPMPNGYEDLSSLTRIVSPYDDILPFNYNHLKLMTKGNSSNNDIEVLKKSLRPYYSRVSKKYLIDRKELLPSISHIIPCEMDEQQNLLYRRLDSFRGKIADEVDEDYLQCLKKAILIRKMQISANPALLKSSLIKSMDELSNEYGDDYLKNNTAIEKLVHIDKDLMSRFMESSILSVINQYFYDKITSGKNKKAAEIALNLLSEGKNVLIWDIFVNNMDAIKKLLEKETGEKVEIINGKVSINDRQKSIKNFREGKSRVILANPATLAESISLHRSCQNAIYVNMNFNAAQFIQSKDRIHRINMPIGTTATYYFLLNRNSVDECVFDRLNEKEKRMIQILDAEDIEVGGFEFEDNSIMSDADVESGYQR